MPSFNFGANDKQPRLPFQEECNDCIEAYKAANSDATTPGFIHDKCEKHRPKEIPSVAQEVQMEIRTGDDKPSSE